MCWPGWQDWLWNGVSAVVGVASALILVAVGISSPRSKKDEAAEALLAQGRMRRGEVPDGLKPFHGRSEAEVLTVENVPIIAAAAFDASPFKDRIIRRHRLQLLALALLVLSFALQLPPTLGHAVCAR